MGEPGDGLAVLGPWSEPWISSRLIFLVRYLSTVLEYCIYVRG